MKLNEYKTHNVVCQKVIFMVEGSRDLHEMTIPSNNKDEAKTELRKILKHNNFLILSSDTVKVMYRMKLEDFIKHGERVEIETESKPEAETEADEAKD